MSAGLIKHLKRKTDEDSNTRILMSQWEFDEKLVGKSLENVGSYYPHFSSHNESHSQQILVNIERLLGNNIEKLTATDTWLILEAAYWHDIGMLFNADEVQKVFEEDDFKEYVESLANDNTQDLHEFAKVWHEDGWNKALVNHSDPHTGVEKYRQMIAEWYRRGHAKNSNSVVLDPFEKLGISSPRTELLPKRIYRYLGQICWAHGLGFDDYVMKTLPFRQTGMGTENCHPRFVACLLRLGDLFDIDDNRFCPVMARQVGNMPSFSETHKHKHQAIREFQLDNETVSVTAICSTEMAYIECRNWFDWIREEIQNQMSQWKNIVPSRDFGLLPTINKLDVEMTDKKILLNNKPMKFSLDERSAIELLQGNNLYKDDMSIYRELIQNAIDATMIRVWLEHGQEHSTKKLPKNANPYNAETRELFGDYSIILDCKKIADDEDSTLWEFSIEDNGVGISRTDLEYMQKIAGSKNNKEKKKIIAQMPEWMRPSGEFGIGLHSAFLLMKDLPAKHQKITIFTKSRLTNESLKIELNSPLFGKAGYCFIEEIDDLKKFGTKIYITEKASKVDIRDHRKNKNSFLEIKDLVFYKGIKAIDLGFLKKITSIKRLLNPPLVSIDYSKKLYDLIPIQNIDNDTDNRKGYFWSSNANSAIKIYFIDESKEETTFQRLHTLKYKGQRVSSFDSNETLVHLPDIFNIKTLYYTIDVYSEKASEIISLSRESILNESLINYRALQAYNDLVSHIKNYNDDILDDMFNSDHKMVALFEKFSNEGLSTTNESWKENFVSNKGLTIDDILNCNSFCNARISKDDLKPLSNIVNINEILVFESYLLDSLLEDEGFQNTLISKGFTKYQILDEKVNKGYFRCLYTKENIKTSTNTLRKIDIHHMHSTLSNIDDFYKLFNWKHAIAPSELVKDILIIESSTIRHSFFSNCIKNNLLRILNNKLIKGSIVVPFINNTDGTIIEIANEQLVQLADAPNEMKEEIDQVYTDLKMFVINKTKEQDSEWYKAYIKGKKFEAVDLSDLNELHKSAT